MKICTKCKIEKPESEFYFDKTNNRLLAKCKSCHKSGVKKYARTYKSRNPDVVREQKRRYYQKNKAKILDRRRDKSAEYERNRWLVDPMYRLKKNIRRSIRSSLSKGGFTKKSRTYCILGCAHEEFVLHIEKQFLSGMSWEKVGREIHIDHIVPLSSAKSEEDVVKLNHFTNLRPMWASENRIKGSKKMYLI